MTAVFLQKNHNTYLMRLWFFVGVNAHFLKLYILFSLISINNSIQSMVVPEKLDYGKALPLPIRQIPAGFTL
jgi:hypothetical protein